MTLPIKNNSKAFFKCTIIRLRRQGVGRLSNWNNLFYNRNLKKKCKALPKKFKILSNNTTTRRAQTYKKFPYISIQTKFCQFLSGGEGWILILSVIIIRWFKKGKMSIWVKCKDMYAFVKRRILKISLIEVF